MALHETPSDLCQVASWFVWHVISCYFWALFFVMAPLFTIETLYNKWCAVIKAPQKTVPDGAVCWMKVWSQPPWLPLLFIFPLSPVRLVQWCLGAANSKHVSISNVLVTVLVYLLLPFSMSCFSYVIMEPNLLYSDLDKKNSLEPHNLMRWPHYFLILFFIYCRQLLLLNVY